MSCAKRTCYSEAALRAPTPVWVDWPWPAWLLDLGRTCRDVSERARQRRALMGLDDRLLADIGLTRDEAVREAGAWPWQTRPPQVRLHDKSPRARTTPLIRAQAGI